MTAEHKEEILRGSLSDDHDNSGESGDGGGDNGSFKIEMYKKRWYIVVLFALYSASNAFQWIQYSIISNIITR